MKSKKIEGIDPVRLADYFRNNEPAVKAFIDLIETMGVLDQKTVTRILTPVLKRLYTIDRLRRQGYTV